MRALERPYPSFTLVLSQNIFSTRIPAYMSAHLGRYQQYPWSQMPNALNSNSPHMLDVTVLSDMREADVGEVVVTLGDEVTRSGHGIRRLSLSILVHDLALVVRRQLERLHLIKREGNVEFVMLD